jgi:hypothetical protein
MKYLENEKLNEISSELSNAVLKDSHRIIQGRIEAYTMKRAGTDKKYAHALGQKYIAEIEDMQEELAATVERKKKSNMYMNYNNKNKRRRSNSCESSFLSTIQSISAKAGTSSTSTAVSTTTLNKKKSKKNTSTKGTSTTTARSRAKSFDQSCTLDNYSPKTTLGDFSELSTRKLMTDLILTLNASFPDYDFSNVKPNQFRKLRMEDVRKSIYEKLSEFASQRQNESSPNFLVDLWYAVNDVIDLRESVVYSFEYEFDNEDSLWNFHYLFVNKNKAVRRIVFFTCSERIDSNTMNNDDKMVGCGEDGQLVIHQEAGDESDSQVRYYNSSHSTPENGQPDDVDWDPSDNVAGGMSLELSI